MPINIPADESKEAANTIAANGNPILCNDIIDMTAANILADNASAKGRFFLNDRNIKRSPSRATRPKLMDDQLSIEKNIQPCFLD